MLLGAAHRDHGQACALLQVLVIDLEHGDVELLQPILDAQQHHSLVLQRLAAGHMELNGQQTDDHLRGDRDALHDEDLDDVADLDVVEVLDADTALEPFAHFADVVLEAAK